MIHAPAQPEQGLSPRFVLSALRQWWKVALPAALLLAAAGSTIVYLTFEPVYEASALFEYEEQTPHLVFDERDDGRSNKFVQTQMQLIREPLILAPTVVRPEVASVPEIAREVDKVAYLKKQIKVVPAADAALFRVMYRSPNATNAANVVNAVVESYFADQHEANGLRTRKVINLLFDEAKKHKDEVIGKRNEVRKLTAEAADKDPFAGKIEANSPQTHPLADLQSQLINARVEGAVLQARIEAAEKELSEQTGGNGSSGHAAVAKGEDKSSAQEAATFSKQEIALRDVMMERIIEEHEEVRRLRAIIAAKRSDLAATERLVAKGRKSAVLERLRADIDSDVEALKQAQLEVAPRAKREAESGILTKRAEMGTLQIERRMEELNKLKSDRANYLAREKLLQQTFDEQKHNVKQSSSDTLDLEFERGELFRSEKVFEAIAERALHMQTEKDALPRIWEREAAKPPVAPVEDLPYRQLAVVLLICLLPFGLAVLWERMIGRVSDPMMLERQSKLSVMGEIAHLPVRSPIGYGVASARIKHDLQLFEESIDSLRTSLSLSQQLADMRILAVTSAASREGKTSVVSQLAMSFARATGKKVLLIDGDMRCPDIHKVFDIDLEPGLAKVLSGECRLEDAIVTSWSDMVHLLPAGRLKVNPHVLLGNGAVPALMSQIPACYRYILIDTPPVLSASEALVLTKVADASLVCVMRDVSRMDQLRRILDRLEAAGSHPVGLVLNGVPVKDYSYRWGEYSYVRT
jgi:capsular exopolysaccharide synthesis family protein